MQDDHFYKILAGFFLLSVSNSWVVMVRIHAMTFQARTVCSSGTKLLAERAQAWGQTYKFPSDTLK